MKYKLYFDSPDEKKNVFSKFSLSNKQCIQFLKWKPKSYKLIKNLLWARHRTNPFWSNHLNAVKTLEVKIIISLSFRLRRKLSVIIKAIEMNFISKSQSLF